MPRGILDARGRRVAASRRREPLKKRRSSFARDHLGSSLDSIRDCLDLCDREFSLEALSLALDLVLDQVHEFRCSGVVKRGRLGDHRRDVIERGRKCSEERHHDRHHGSPLDAMLFLVEPRFSQ
ncbi:MAG: hypothetical protein A2V88_04360 [Elusimicrobia bacterium RBG_16_66_12]|nr:MAG: hypothetical protein A2V88_04360 [Elusimicrobia bacterium RBG_16_66_12]